MPQITTEKVILDGYSFDSRIETDYYEQLKRRQVEKDILFFRLQPRYLLQHAFKKGGEQYNTIEYIADFEIHHNDGSIEVVDVVDTKSITTDVLSIKIKMFNKRYPHKLTILKKE